MLIAEAHVAKHLNGVGVWEGGFGKRLISRDYLVT